VAGENLPLRIDPGADGLGDADNNAAGEGAPQATEPTDDHRLEGVEQTRGPDRRVEIGAQAERHRGDHRHRERNADRNGVDLPLVDAHQLGDLRLVGGGAERPPDRGTVEQQLQQHDGDDRGYQRGERGDAHGQARHR